MLKIKNFIENNFAVSLLVAAILALFLPGFGKYSNDIVIFLIAGLVFFASPQVKRDELLSVDIFQVGLFTVLRFAVFPIILFYIAQAIVPEYAEGILLLALMPAAMAVTSLCSISGSKVALGLSLTVISSVLVPVFVPSIFSFLGRFVEINVFGLFATLMMVIFVPFIIYFGIINKIQPIKNWVISNTKLMPILLMSLVLFIVISANKEQFLDNVDLLITGSIVMMVVFGLFYLFGIVFSFFVPQDQRGSYVFASGAINNGLAIGLSFLYFSPHTVFFVVISEIVWCVYVAVAQWFFSRKTT